MDKVLTERQRSVLRHALVGLLVVFVDSTGLMVALWAADLRRIW